MTKRSPSSTRTTEYSAWSNMRQRCNNPNHPNFDYYGGRGISVCERWGSFDAFLQDMGYRPKGLTLERKDNNGNYTPENCVWETRHAQQRNRRCSILIGGLTTVEASHELNISQTAIRKRLRRGFDVFKPVGYYCLGGTKTTETDVKNVRSLAAKYGVKKGNFVRIQRELGLTYGVVRNIMLGKTFKCIK